MEVGSTSLAMVRGSDGAVRAFYNTCRHRGSKVCVVNTAKQRTRLPLPPVTYDLDGRLLFARDMGSGL